MENISSHTNTLPGKTSVNRMKASSYCLRVISIWNQRYPRRQIPVSEIIEPQNIPERKGNRVLRTLPQ